MDINSYLSPEEKIARLTAIVQSFDDAIITKTLDGIITGWNQSAERLYGYSATEAIGQPIFILVPPDRITEEQELLYRVKKGDRISNFETQRLTRDNRIIDISLSISPIFNEKGVITGVSKVARDITQHKRANRLVLESEERLRLATESAGFGTWDLDIISGRIICSKQYRDIFGFKDEEWCWDKFFASVSPDDLPILERAFQKALKTGKFTCELRVIKKNKYRIQRWIRLNGKTLFDYNHNPLRVLGTVVNITGEKTQAERLERKVAERTQSLKKKNEELKVAEKKMKQYTTELEFQNKELEQFAYIASHDLQEPLRKILTFVDLLHRDFEDKALAKKYFDKIRMSAGRMSALIRDVLDYSRLSDSKDKFAKVDLNKVLVNVENDFELLIAEKRAGLTVSELPVIRGIPAQLHQLFSNLLGNSLKFSSADPTVAISARMATADEVNSIRGLDRNVKYHVISVRDNGIGFEQQYAEKIFIIFQRLNHKQTYSGTGIGLALCKKIVENHHGHIAARSEPGKGAEFSIYLPC